MSGIIFKRDKNFIDFIPSHRSRNSLERTYEQANVEEIWAQDKKLHTFFDVLQHIILNTTLIVLTHYLTGFSSSSLL